MRGWHHVRIDPELCWEQLRIGGGAPPLRTPLGWLLLYHGVTGHIARRPGERQWVRYVAGVLVLDADDPHLVRYRSPTPNLKPETEEERRGVVPNVIFPTGSDDRGNGRVDVYYGMADQCIGVARLQVLASLP
jgi:predicted GH43/DUF377 family glycosyl hydrolase